MTLIGKGNKDSYLTINEMRDIFFRAFGSLKLQGKRVLMIIPDGTRSMPMPEIFSILCENIAPVLGTLDFLIALGTHQKMSDQQLTQLVGQTVTNGQVGNIHIYNHEWEKEETFTEIGILPSQFISDKTNGMMTSDVPIRINKLIFDYDHIIICGPVFPHEVVGFSGGNKYFVPGIAGPEIINFTHWLGALITSYKIIGTHQTPVRDVINHAAEFIKLPVSCFSLVVTHAGLAGIYFGAAKEAWAAAAALSAQKHITYVKRPYQKVLSIMPAFYDDIWTAAKGMYKLEPVIADQGEVVIYAPHISEISYTHGKILDEIGYHCRDYFVKQWDKFKEYPQGVLAHSTHLCGMGSYDPLTGIETKRVNVTLATGISAEHCHRVGLGYRDPSSINFQDWENKEADGILVVPQAGEMLYRLKNEKVR